ncbi:hypothetical protein P354_40115 [Streptomyces noursei PD-1]|nr:hypothetical protein P354_40115 [Streptomyces noursei PD-1]
MRLGLLLGLRAASAPARQLALDRRLLRGGLGDRSGRGRLDGHGVRLGGGPRRRQGTRGGGRCASGIPIHGFESYPVYR